MDHMTKIHYLDVTNRDNHPGIGSNAFAHESGILADGALKDHANYELYDEEALGPWPSDWHARQGRVVLTGEYGGKAGFRHVTDSLGIEVTDEDTSFQIGRASCRERV